MGSYTAVAHGQHTPWMIVLGHAIPQASASARRPTLNSHLALLGGCTATLSPRVGRLRTSIHNPPHPRVSRRLDRSRGSGRASTRLPSPAAQQNSKSAPPAFVSSFQPASSTRVLRPYVPRSFSSHPLLPSLLVRFHAVREASGYRTTFPQPAVAAVGGVSRARVPSGLAQAGGGF